jgi:hypothetical protein
VTAVHDRPQASEGSQAEAAEARRSGSLSGLITTTVVPPSDAAISDKGIDITTIPNSWMGPDYDHPAEIAEGEFGLQPLLVVEPRTGLAESIAALLSEYDNGEEDLYNFREEVRDKVRRLTNEGPESPQQERTLRFAEYVALAETVLVEESPARRTSPAAVAASRLATAVLTTGGASTTATAVLAHQGTSLFIVLMGSGVTLLIAVAGAGLILATHWAAKRLEV